MNTVGADQDVAARGLHMVVVAVEEIGGDAAFVLREGDQFAAGMDRFLAEALLHRLMDHALQTAAMNRELRHVEARAITALLAPDFLTVTVEIVQLIGADGDGIEPVEQTEAGEFADRVGQRVDANTEFADRICLFEQLAVDATCPQHQCRCQTANATTDDDRFHHTLHSLIS